MTGSNPVGQGSSPWGRALRQTVPWSNGDDAWVTSRKRWFDSIRDHCETRRSVGVPAAHLRGKEGDRVRFPDGPLEKWACMPLAATDPCKVGVMGSTPIRSTQQDRAAGPTGRRLARIQAIGVQFPGGPLDLAGSWSNGKTPVRQTGNPGSIPGGSSEMEGSRIRFAGPVC